MTMTLTGLSDLPLKEKDEGMLEMTSQESLHVQPSPRVLNTHVHFEQLPSQVRRQMTWIAENGG